MSASARAGSASALDGLGSQQDLGAVLRDFAERTPDKVFLRFVDGGDDSQVAVTYGELDRRARAVASQLQTSGATRRPVLLLHPPGVAYIEALFACFYAGAIAVPAYPPRANRSLPRLRSLVANCQASVALTTRALLDKTQLQRVRDPELAKLTWLATDEAESGTLSLAHTASDAIAVLQYTSGSTSSPKGVMLSHANLLANVIALAERAELGPGDHMVSWLPPYHDMGLIGGILLPLCAGSGLTLMSPSAFIERPLRWLDAVSRTRASMSGAPNFAYELCARRITPAQFEALDLRAWRVAFCGAERIRADTFRRFVAAAAPAGFDARAFAPCYGLAEATLGVTFRRRDRTLCIERIADAALARGQAELAEPDARARELVGCGQLLQDCALLIVDPERGTPLPERSIGEIWVRSPAVSGGYWNDPASSQRVFRARLAGGTAHVDYLRTGDLGYLSGDTLFVTGRIKDLLILRGQNYYPEDVEGTAQYAHAALRPGCGVAFAIEGQDHEALVIVHEVDAAAESEAPAIMAAVQSAVAQEHELPVADVVLVRPGSIPKTSSGKLQRARCRQQYLEGGLTRLGSVVDRGATEPEATSALTTQIAAAMAELLGLDEVGPEADFLWLGGHSLQATQLLSRLREQLHVEVGLQQLFEAATPRKLAARIEALRSTREPSNEAQPELVRVDRSAQLPLSFSQERMWFLHQLDPRGSAYNVAGAVQIDGPVVFSALTAAFDEVVRQHEVLRTNFSSSDGEPELVIHAERRLSLPLLDFSAHLDAAAHAVQAASELAAMPFDVAHDLLVRAALYKIAPERHVLAVSMHHLVTDAWSMGVLVHDLMEHYDALLHARPTLAPEADLTYVDYAAWQRKQLGTARMQRELAFWRTRLAGAEPLLLPTNRPRSRARGSAGALEPLTLSPALREALRELGQRHGSTLFMVLMAAFEVVLQRHSGQTDIVIGVPVANRMRVASEAFIGTLVNTLAVRAEVTPDLSFATLLRHVRERSLEAFDHQDLPFERLVSELGIARRAGSSPLVQVMFDYQNVPMAFRSGGLTLSPVVLARGAAQFDLSLLYHDTELGQSGGIEYSTDLFDAETIRRFGEHYLSVLEAVVRDPSCVIGQIPLLRESERAQVLSLAGEVSGSAHAAASVNARFAQQALARPGVRAVSDAHGMLTYAELSQRVEVLAQRLHGAGAGPGERVGVYLERSKELVVALLAVLRAGAAYVPLDPRHPPSRIHYVLEDAAPRIIVTDAQARATLPDVIAGAQILVLAGGVEHAVLDPSTLREPAPEQAAYVIYTSGSTGRPKGVEISRGALDNFLASMARGPGLSASDRVLSTTTIAFDIAALELLLPMIVGAAVHVAPADVVGDAQRLAALVERVQPTLMQATPATWRMLIEAGFVGDPKLTILCGGEALSRELADQLLERGAAVWNMYGPTETTVWSLLHKVEHGADVPIGRPIDQTRVYIVDTNGALCPLGVAGEICIGGAGVASGYYKRPDLTRERFVSDPFARAANSRMYRTGDLGRLRADGNFEHLGRLDHQIKVRGFRIEPGEIEAVLREDPRVRQALVIAREDRRDDVRLVAYYVTDEQSAGAGLELRELLRRRLPDYMIPSAFVALAELPRTPNGKIDRAALPLPDISHVALGAERVAPRDPLEIGLARLWEDILGTREPGVRDSFFALGGHSLLAVRMFARIRREHGVDLPLATLFEAPTIEYLAERIRELARTNVVAAQPAPTLSLPAQSVSAPAAGSFAYLVPIRSEGTRRPLFCVHGAGGNVLGFAAIASHLGTGRPFYGLQARGVDGQSEPFAHIEEAAAAYLREIRMLQPSGPYHLAGYCGGGTIAFEMARMLSEAGEAVGLLALMDTYRPGVGIGRSRAAQLARNWSRHGTAFVARRIAARLRSDADMRTTGARITYHQLRGRAVPHELRDHWLTFAFFEAVAHYRPRPYRGRVTILRASHVDEALLSVGRELGWAGLATEGIEVHDVPGTHDTLIEEPHASVLGATLRQCLDHADAIEDDG